MGRPWQAREAQGLMPTTVAVTFPWGRYHATPWDRNVNEGVVEWPPSPWRLLRALYAVWKNRCPHLPAESVEKVLGALADPPRYRLPSAFDVVHTRHYLPGIGHRPGVKTETTKTFDPTVVVARDAVVLIDWHVQLGHEETQCLAELLDALPYLGRAESIVSAALVASPPGGDWLERVVSGADVDLVRLLAPTHPLDLDALTMTPHQVRSLGLLQPPSTRWIDYPAPVTRFERMPTQGTRSAGPRRTAVRLAVTGPARPTRFAGVACGDLLRRAALANFGRDHDGAPSATLAGKDEAGAPNRGPHDHAHYLPLADATGLLEAMVVWAPRGLSDAEVVAISRTRRLRPSRDQQVAGLSGRDVRLGIESIGSMMDVAPELCVASRTWVSATPYSPSRHRKGDLEVQLVTDIAEELDRRGLPAPIAVELLRGDWQSFRRYRLSESIRQGRRPHGLRLRFDTPVPGPIVVGKLSHFGLGVFVPEPVDGS